MPQQGAAWCSNGLCFCGPQVNANAAQLYTAHQETNSLYYTCLKNPNENEMPFLWPSGGRKRCAAVPAHLAAGAARGVVALPGGDDRAPRE